MLSLATAEDPKIFVSTLEFDRRTTRYTVETLPELIEMNPDAELFFVMGADSWMDIRTWKQWEEVLTMSDHIVVTRPGYDLGFEHVTDEIRERIVDLRGERSKSLVEFERPSKAIYVTDAIRFDASATELREDLSDGVLDQTDDLPLEVAKYIEKYELYI